MAVNATEAEEVLQFLVPSAQGHVKAIALDYFLGLTGTKQGVTFISSNNKYLSAIVGLTEDTNALISKNAYLALVNLSGEEKVAEQLLSLEDHKDFLFNLLKYVINPKSDYADAVSTILSNMARNANCADQMVREIISKKDDIGFDKLIQAFCTNKYNEKNRLDYIGPVLSNLAQNREARKYILDREKCVIQRLLPFANFTGSLVRRHGVIGTIRNCCFETDSHEWLLSDSVDILPRLLLPLAGPEEFDDDDMEKLPVDLQYLEPDKEREPDPDIRKMLVETIFQLCALKTCRLYIKENGAYLILRELHKWEKNEETKEAVENLVQVLIGDEPETGMENLNEVELPQDVQEKFSEMDMKKDADQST